MLYRPDEMEVVERESFWGGDRLRRWRRNAIMTAVVMLFVLALGAGIYEWRVRSQAALARSETPIAADVAALFARHRPGVPQVERTEVERIIEASERRRAEIEERILSTAERHARNWIGYELVLEPEAEQVADPELRADDARAAEHARRAIAQLDPRAAPGTLRR